MHRLCRVAAVAAVVSAALVTRAGAQAVDADPVLPDTLLIELSPLEVLVSIAPRAGPSVGSGMPARISIMSRDEIVAWRPRILAEALSTQAGVSLYDDLGSPQKLNLSARGFSVGPTVGLPSGVSVFLDGIRQNEPSAQEVNFDLLPLEHVERIEFLRGNASLLGPNSLGGAVNLITRSGGGEPAGELALSAGSFGLTEAEGNVSGQLLEAWDYYLGGGYEEEGGWRDATRGERFNGFLNMGRAEGDRGLRLQALWTDSSAETAGSLPESIFAVDPQVNFTAGDFESLELQQIRVSGYSPMLGTRASLTAFFRRTDAERFNVNQPPEGDVRSLSENQTLGGTGDWSRVASVNGRNLSVRFGLDLVASWSRVRIFEEASEGPARELTTDVKSPRVDFAAYAMADLQVDRATISAGARLDYVRVPFEDLLDPAADTVNRFTRLSPRAGASFDLGRGVRTFASAGLSFRAPAVVELACADPEDACPLPFALGDDPPLDPVVATNYEIGAEWGDGRADISTSLYRTDVDDEIFFVPSEGSIVEGFFRNLGPTRRAGVELEARVSPMNEVSVYGNYAYTRATFRRTEEIFSARADSDVATSELAGANIALPGDRLPMIPGHQAKAGGSYSHSSGLTVGLDGRYLGKQWLRGDEANETRPLGGYFTANTRASLRLGPWEIEGILYNLLGADEPMFGTFNVNQGTEELERFLTPLNARAVRVAVRRSFGAAR